MKNTQISNFMKIRLVDFELFHADGRTDMTKLTDTFRNFANAPKNEKIKNTCDLKTWAFYPFGRNFKRQSAE